MTPTYLTTPFAEKDRVKALGAKWDGAQRKWFVPDGLDLAPFGPWLPATGQSSESGSVSGSGSESGTGTSVALVDISEFSTFDTPSSHFTTFTTSADLSFPAHPATATASLAAKPALLRQSLTLSALLAGVSKCIKNAYPASAWTMVEVVSARLNNGSVYLEVSERSASGVVLAKSSAVIWASNASRILPEFERATGANIGQGIKLLVRARPTFTPKHGFNIDIDAIDPDYTLGDLEAKKRDIRQRLQQAGIFEANRRLSTPWDFNVVLVVAPQGGAGLGDFQAQAKRLEQFGVCRFTYVHSRFQGEGAASEIQQALLAALAACKAKGSGNGGDSDGSGSYSSSDNGSSSSSRISAPNAFFDAVVIIRGGGAVNDLAWLNDYWLARCICELGLPVLTGIGHERDSTILDEVAHTKFDTPSKAIAGIEQLIARRTQEAKAYFEQVDKAASLALSALRREVELSNAFIKSGALHQLALARQDTAACLSQLRLGSARSVRDGAESAQALMVDVRHKAMRVLSDAKQTVPAWMAEVNSGAKQASLAAKADTQKLIAAVTGRVGEAAKHSRQGIDRALQEVGTNSRRAVVEAASKSQALMREIAGQGPEKTLARGFAIVRRADGATITRAGAVLAGEAIDIQLGDGALTATVAVGNTRKHT